jgi:hypothetical protein
MKKIVEIIPGLFLGNKYAAADETLLLKTIGITHILNIGGGKNHFEHYISYLK